jgi:hypothetical protein
MAGTIIERGVATLGENGHSVITLEGTPGRPNALDTAAGVMTGIKPTKGWDSASDTTASSFCKLSPRRGLVVLGEGGGEYCETSREVSD